MNSKIITFGMKETIAKDILEIGLSTGAEFAEVFMEESLQEVFQMTSGKISGVTYNKGNGVALRIIKDGTEVNSSITSLDPAEIKLAMKELASSFEGTKTTTTEKFATKTIAKVTTALRERSADSKEEIALLNRLTEAAINESTEIKQVMANLTRKTQTMLVFATDGTYQTDNRCHMRLTISVIASDGTKMHQNHDSKGMAAGLEQYDNFDVEAFAKEVARDAVAMLHADDAPGGTMPVVINNGFGGVILHEACVHSLEATSVARDASVFCGKLGQKIASDIVNAVDDGTNLNAWGSINIDDEGTESRCNVLIENGILKSYLVDKKNAKKMNHPITGSSRRESYKYPTTSRMTNTYFLNGTSTFDEIIKATKYGLFAKKMGGGSVNPATGEFNFAVDVGYLIEDGKITKPVKGATLVGSGKDVLLRIDMIGDNLSCGQGVCGSLSGSVFANVGQPTIRVSSMTVGGSGKGAN